LFKLKSNEKQNNASSQTMSHVLGRIIVFWAELFVGEIVSITSSWLGDQYVDAFC